MMKFLDASEFHALAKRGGDLRDVGLCRDAIGADPSSTGPVPWTFSTNGVDLMNDRALDWDLKNFRRNPIALWAHNSLMPPVGKVLGINFSGGRLTGAVQFASAASSFAASIEKMVRGGWIRASSVGFRPLKWKRSSDPARPDGIDFELCELLEISIVSVPANADALVSSSMASPKSSVAERVADAGRRRREVEAEELATLLRPARVARAAALRREIEGAG